MENPKRVLPWYVDSCPSNVALGGSKTERSTTSVFEKAYAENAGKESPGRIASLATCASAGR